MSDPEGSNVEWGDKTPPYQLGRAAQADFWRDSTSIYCEIAEWNQVEPVQGY